MWILSATHYTVSKFFRAVLTKTKKKELKINKKPITLLLIINSVVHGKQKTKTPASKVKNVKKI